MNVNRRTVYTWEAGRSEPTVERLESLAKLYQRPTEWLLHGEGDARSAKLDSIRDRAARLPDNLLPVLEDFLTTLENSNSGRGARTKRPR